MLRNGRAWRRLRYRRNQRLAECGARFRVEDVDEAAVLVPLLAPLDSIPLLCPGEPDEMHELVVNGSGSGDEFLVFEEANEAQTLVELPLPLTSGLRFHTILQIYRRASDVANVKDESPGIGCKRGQSLSALDGETVVSRRPRGIHRSNDERDRRQDCSKDGRRGDRN
jgi:hypothetical protein